MNAIDDDDNNSENDEEEEDEADQIYGVGYKEEWQLCDDSDQEEGQQAEDDDDNEDDDQQNSDVELEHDAQLPPQPLSFAQQYDDEEEEEASTTSSHAAAAASSTFPPPPPPPTAWPNVLPRSKRVDEMNLPPWNKKEQQDFEASIEHLVMAGNYARHMAWRKSAWERRERKQNQLQEHDGEEQEGQQCKSGDERGENDDEEKEDQENDSEDKYHEQDDNGVDDNDDGPSESLNEMAAAETDTPAGAAAASATTCNEKKDGDRLPTWFERMVHAEDVRIYGENGYHDVPWPIPFTRYHQQVLQEKMWIPMSYRRKTKRQTPQLDVAWDIEHGDGLHPLLFHDTRCSKRIKQRHDASSTGEATCEQQPQATVLAPPTTDAKETLSNLSYQQQTPTVQVPDVPRAMILRCWERAVHAASCTIACPVSDETQTTTSLSTDPSSVVRADSVGVGASGGAASMVTTILDDSDPFLASQQQEPLSTSNTMNTNYSACIAAMKCGNLEIPLLPRDTPPPLPCPSCKVLFDDSNHLDQHFFGTNHMGGGCVWQLIYRRQEELIRKVLQEQFTRQTAALLRLLFTQAQKDVALLREQQLANNKKKKEQIADANNGNDEQGDDNDNGSANIGVAAPPSLLLDTPLPNKTWQDVLRYMRLALDQSTTCIPNSEYVLPQPADYLAMTSASATVPGMPFPPTLLETLQTEADALPLIINHELLTVVSERLIDRYANVPS